MPELPTGFKFLHGLRRTPRRANPPIIALTLTVLAAFTEGSSELFWFGQYILGWTIMLAAPTYYWLGKPLHTTETKTTNNPGDTTCEFLCIVPNQSDWLEILE